MLFAGWFRVFYFIVVDKISFLLSSLTLWVVIVLLYCAVSYKEKRQFFVFALLGISVLGLLLILSFRVSNMFSFYIFFEFSLLPILYLVLA